MIFLAKEAEHVLGSLANGTQKELWERVNDILDAIEDDPGDRKVRRRRFDRPPLWAVPVSGSGERYMVLWNETSEHILIQYIGPAIF